MTHTYLIDIVVNGQRIGVPVGFPMCQVVSGKYAEDAPTDKGAAVVALRKLADQLEAAGAA